MATTDPSALNGLLVLDIYEAINCIRSTTCYVYLYQQQEDVNTFRHACYVAR